jgi:hypothetical protein
MIYGTVELSSIDKTPQKRKMIAALELYYLR